jgi:phosphoglycolate phosphatase-like HAD superfamily hydrolase
MTDPIGYDLDMTLLDTWPTIAATYQDMTRRDGTAIDLAQAYEMRGLPLGDQLAQWYPPGQITAATALYRMLYPDHAHLSRPLPGAVEAIAASGRIVIATAKTEHLARLHLHALGNPDARITGSVFGEQKIDALRGCSAYVGDHPADMWAALGAGAIPIGVTTGAHTAAQLLEAGAVHVLASLEALPDLIARGLRRHTREASR